jgi:hypothetical protein
VGISNILGIGKTPGLAHRKKPQSEAAMTTLKDFVKDTLSQISEGVSAFEDASDAKTRVQAGIEGNLAGDAAAATGRLDLGAGKGFATVGKFNVAVTTEETEAAHGSAGIKVIPFNIGGGLDAKMLTFLQRFTYELSFITSASNISSLSRSGAQKELICWDNCAPRINTTRLSSNVVKLIFSL